MPISSQCYAERPSQICNIFFEHGLCLTPLPLPLEDFPAVFIHISHLYLSIYKSEVVIWVGLLKNVTKTLERGCLPCSKVNLAEGSFRGKPLSYSLYQELFHPPQNLAPWTISYSARWGIAAYGSACAMSLCKSFSLSHGNLLTNEFANDKSHNNAVLRADH